MLAQVGNGLVAVKDNKFYDLKSGKEKSLEELKAEKKGDVPVMETPEEPEVEEEVEDAPKPKGKGKGKNK